MLLSGNRPRFFSKKISWDSFIAGHGIVQCRHPSADSVLEELSVDPKLRNAFRDLHAFSCLSNLAYQTTRKLSPAFYNEMMESILYRLTHLQFETDPIQEALRIGLLALSSTIFMQRQFMSQPSDHLLNLYTMLCPSCTNRRTLIHCCRHPLFFG